MVTPYKVCMGLVAEDRLTDYNYLFTAVGAWFFRSYRGENRYIPMFNNYYYAFSIIIIRNSRSGSNLRGAWDILGCI